MADDAFPASRCEICEISLNLKRCARCKQVFYCSREHQIKHWSMHKKVCRKSNLNSGADDTEPERKTKSDENDFIEFDQRPYKEGHSEVPASYDFEDLAKQMTEKLKSNGHCVIDGLFDDELMGKLCAEFEMVSSKGDMKPGQLSGGKTSGEDDLKVTKKEIRSDLITWIDGTEKHIPATCEVVKIIDDILERFNQYFEDECIVKGRTKAMMACYPGNGSYYRRHVDNPNKDGRVITCILYLNKDWDVEKDGGMLRILPENSEDHIDIAPTLNRLLIFWSDRRNPHEVHPAHRTRYALTIWYFDGEERTQAKADQLNQETSKVQEELSWLALKTKQTEKEIIETKITSISQKAVAGLTEGELDAFGTLVRGHPDPRGALSSLGIPSSIQDALLSVLSNKVT